MEGLFRIACLNVDNLTGCLRILKFEIKFVVRASILVLLALIITACGSIKPVQKPRNIVEVGRPLVFDGSRLIQEFSERRLAIDNAIGSAEIQDIETVGSISSSSRLELGLQVARLSDEGAINALRQSQQFQQDTDANRVALQNLQLESVEEQLRLANAQAQESREQSTQQTELNAIKLQNYQAQIDYYTEVLRTTPNIPENKDVREGALTQLSNMRAEMSTLTFAATTIPNTADVTFPESATDTSRSDLLPGVAAVNNTALSEVAPFDKTSEALSKIGSESSTRLEQFQQYQSYIDELYATRNQYVLDDSHLRPGRRLVRLVVPVYVPPANTDNIRTVRISVHPGASSLEKTAENVRNNDQIYTAALLQAANHLTRNRNDNQLRYVSFNEQVSEVESRFINDDNLSRFIGCNDPLSLCSCSNLTPDQKSEFRNTNDVNETESLSYDELVKNCWSALQALQILGDQQVLSCLTYSPVRNAWSLATSSCSLKPEGSDDEHPEIYGVRPLIDREKVERESSRVFGLALAFGDAFGSSGLSSIGTTNASAQYARAQIARAASRLPVVAAFRGRASTKGERPEIGWHVYPRIALNRNGKPVRVHTGTQFNGVVDLSVPDQWSSAHIKIYVDDGSSPIAQFTMAIPKLTPLEAVSNLFATPVVSEIKEFGEVDIQQQISIPISGLNLWRSPDVLIGGRRANRVQYVSESPDHLVATFNDLKGISCDYSRENFNQTERRYWGESVSSEKYCASRIMLHTSDGKAFVGSVLTKRNAKSAQKAPAITATFQSASIAKDTLSLLFQESSEADYTKGTAATLTQIIGGSTGKTITMVVGDSTPVDGNPKLKTVSLSGTIVGDFCDVAKSKLSTCFVRLALGKVVKFQGEISIAKE